MSIAGKQFGVHFIQRSGCGYLPASVRHAAAEVSAIEQLPSVKWTLDDPLQKRIPFSTSRIEGMASGCIPPPKPRTASSRSMTPRLLNPPVSARR
jgi:hypothetical protein